MATTRKMKRHIPRGGSRRIVMRSKSKGTRKFGGITFKLAGVHPSLVDAQDQARRIETGGGRYRIQAARFPDMGQTGYVVWKG